jgi:CRISPR-associated Cas5-like protein
VVGPMVSDVPDQLSRSRVDAAGPWGGGGPHQHLSPDPSLAELEKRIRPHLRMNNGSWRMDETYVKVKGRWVYLYRAVDSRGQRWSAPVPPRAALIGTLLVLRTGIPWQMLPAEMGCGSGVAC